MTRKSKDTQAAPVPDLETALTELEQIVERLETGELSLDESLKQFERGIQLTRQCQSALRTAEQKVDILLRKTGVGDEGFVTEPFSDRDLQTPTAE